MIRNILVVAAPSARGCSRLSRLSAVLEAVAPVNTSWSETGEIPGGTKADLLVLWQLSPTGLRWQRTGAGTLLYVPDPEAPGALDRGLRRQLRGHKVLCYSAQQYAACHQQGLDAFLLQANPESTGARAALQAFCRRPARRPGLQLPARLVESLRKRAVVAVPPRPAREVPPQPLVSIVTVVRNDAPGLSQTLRSVFTQSRQDFEYLVVDGASTDGTLDLVRAHAAGIEQWVSEPDRGPYDAMAKGARLARGRFVLFMNAGDEFVSELALEEALRKAPADADILYGHHFYLRRNGLCMARPAADLRHTYDALCESRLSGEWMGGIPCHQSTFVARRWLVERGFDPTLRVAADHDLLFDLMAQGCRAHHTGTYVARYVAGGMSRKMLDTCYADWEHIGLRHAGDPATVRAFYAAMRAPRGIKRMFSRFGRRVSQG